MGTNYYWRRDGTHIAKTSSVGGGKFKVFWAIEPRIVRRMHAAKANREVIDEYGHEMPLSDFVTKVDKATENDTSTVGEEFS